MKFTCSFNFFFYLTLIGTLILTVGCKNRDHDSQLERLISESRKTGPAIATPFLGIHFGDSKMLYHRRLDSLYELGLIDLFVADSLIHKVDELKYYKYYYRFADKEMVTTGKWIFSPAFEDNRLISLGLINSPVLDKNLGKEILQSDKGFLQQLIDSSREVEDEADLTYRIAKTYMNQQYGKLDYTAPNKKITYWIKSNLVMSLNLRLGTVEILFKDSK